MLTSQLAHRQNRFPDENLAVVRGRLDTLTQQLAQVNRLPQQDLAAVNGRLDTLALAVDQLVRVHRADRPAAERADETSRELADAASPLDQAMSEIAERQRDLDGEAGPGRLSQNLSGLEDQLRQINAQIETMRPCSLDSASETLRDDLAEIGRMLKEAMPRKAIEALETEVRSLAVDAKARGSHVGVMIIDELRADGATFGPIKEVFVGP